jgi:hypothetical protein
MRKLLLILLLTLFNTSAMAEWTLFNELAGDVNMYVDSTTIKNGGELAKVWVLKDYKEPTKGGYKSTLEQMEFHCKDETFRLMQAILYDGQMQKGMVMTTYKYTIKEFPFEEIVPNTYMKSLFSIVCKP